MILPSVKQDRFTATVKVLEAKSSDLATHLLLKGDADLDVAEPLGAFLVRADVIARELGVREVVLDLRQVELLTSSCLKPFLAWLLGLKDREKPYKVVIRTDSRKDWQAHTVSALICFAQEIVRVEG